MRDWRSPIIASVNGVKLMAKLDVSRSMLEPDVMRAQPGLLSSSRPCRPDEVSIAFIEQIRMSHPHSFTMRLFLSVRGLCFPLENDAEVANGKGLFSLKISSFANDRAF